MFSSLENSDLGTALGWEQERFCTCPGAWGMVVVTCPGKGHSGGEGEWGFFISVFSFRTLYWDIIYTHKLHAFKEYNSMAFSIFTDLCKHHHCHFPSSLRKPPYPPSPPSPPRQPQATTKVVSVSGFAYSVHSYGLIQYVAFCDWILSPHLFSTFIHVVAVITASFLLCKWTRGGPRLFISSRQSEKSSSKAHWCQTQNFTPSAVLRITRQADF